VIPFFAYPQDVRRVLYTTNAIESLNMQLRKITKNRGHFPSDEAATKLLYLALRNVTAKWKNAGREWKPALTQFAILFADRFCRRGDVRSFFQPTSHTEFPTRSSSDILSSWRLTTVAHSPSNGEAMAGAIGFASMRVTPGAVSHSSAIHLHRKCAPLSTKSWPHPLAGGRSSCIMQDNLYCGVCVMAD